MTHKILQTVHSLYVVLNEWQSKNLHLVHSVVCSLQSCFTTQSCCLATSKVDSIANLHN